MVAGYAVQRPFATYIGEGARYSNSCGRPGSKAPAIHFPDHTRDIVHTVRLRSMEA